MVTAPVENIVTGFFFFEKSRRGILDGLRKFIAVDNHEAVKVGDLEKNMEGHFPKCRGIRIGNPCTTVTLRCTHRSQATKLEKTRRPGHCGP